MLIEGTLNRYLADINQQAEQMFHRSIEEMAQKQGVTEQLKADQPMEWIGLMNNIRACNIDNKTWQNVLDKKTWREYNKDVTRKLGMEVFLCKRMKS